MTTPTMPETPLTNPWRQALPQFVGSAHEFATGIDAWLGKFGPLRNKTGSERIPVLEHLENLRLFVAASRMGRSMGIYGQSQGGKSNLVSRIGSGLGAQTKDGSLLVFDPSLEPSQAPWALGDRPGTIEFSSWLNPVKESESTGVICRFTPQQPEGVHPGCFLARVMSHSELVQSIAIGNSSEVEYKAFGPDIQELMRELRAAKTEPDPERFMPSVLSAWRFLQARWTSQGVLNSRARELVDLGWDQLVRTHVMNGTRLRWNPNQRGDCDHLRLVSLLWSCGGRLTDVYRSLLQALQEISHAQEVSIPVADVCRTADSGPMSHASLLDVNHLVRLFEETAGTDGVTIFYRTDRARPERSHALGRSRLAALVRELVLPVALEGAGPREHAIDVIDYPGARKSSGTQTFGLEGKHMSETDADTEDIRLALDVYRRGKLNCLFLTALALQDCSSLCLVVPGAGTPDAGEDISRALGEWLNREDWKPEGPTYESRMSHEPAPLPIDPPLVVAVTKADMLLNPSNVTSSLFGDRLGLIKQTYSKDSLWFTKWCGGAFSRIYWVHNPKAHNAGSPDRFRASDPATFAAIKRNYMLDKQVGEHLGAEKEARFEAIFNSPTDVDGLFGCLRALTVGVKREERLLSSVFDVLDRLIDGSEADYLGADNSRRTADERRAAALDMGFLEQAMDQGRNPVSHLLRALQVTPAAVQRACRRAAEEAAGIDEGRVGILNVDDFYGALSADFAGRFEDQLPQLVELCSVKQQGADELGAIHRLDSIKQHFIQLSRLDWFRSRVLTERVVGMFDTRDAEWLATNAVLATTVSSAWNRNVVWLDREVAVPETLPQLPPTRRKAHASSAKIIEHWKRRLPDVYVALVDPKGASSPGNKDLGTMREALAIAVRELQGAVPLVKSIESGIGRRAASMLERLKP